jgi:hypothetical protein
MQPRYLKVIETVRSAVAPSAGLILDWPGEGRCEKRRVGFLLLVAILFPPLFEMKLALSREEESQCTFQGGNLREGRRRHAERIKQ